MSLRLGMLLVVVLGCVRAQEPALEAPSEPAVEAPRPETFEEARARCARSSRCRAKEATALRVSPPDAAELPPGLAGQQARPEAGGQTQYACVCQCSADADCGEDARCLVRPGTPETPALQYCGDPKAATQSPPGGIR